MGARSLLIIGGVATATLFYLVFLAVTFEAPEGTTTVVVPPTPVVVEPALLTIPEPIPEPLIPPPVETILEPETVVVVEPEQEAPIVERVELPSLGESDSFVIRHLRQMESAAAIIGFLSDEQIIRRIVVLVDNLSKETLPQNNLPYQSVRPSLPVTNIDENLFVLDEAGHARFDSVVDAVMAIDSEPGMVLYRLFSPLLQQAYAELGYRDVRFDDTLRRALRNVLETNEIEGPFQLVKPSVMYIYADANIENMNDIQKQIIRLGPENAENLKTKIREFLQLL